MGLKFSKPHPPTVCQIKTPVQSVENPEGFGGMIIYDQETFTINKPHLMAVPDHRALISFEQLCQTTSVLKEVVATNSFSQLVDNDLKVGGKTVVHSKKRQQ